MSKTYASPGKEFHLYRESDLLIATWTTTRSVSNDVFEQHCVVAAEWAKESPATVALTCAANYSPNAKQRAMVKRYVPVMAHGLREFVLLSDSALARAAQTAILWLIGPRQTQYRAMPTRDYKKALRLLRHVGNFDEAAAAEALAEANRYLENPWPTA